MVVVGEVLESKDEEVVVSVVEEVLDPIEELVSVEELELDMVVSSVVLEAVESTEESVEVEEDVVESDEEELG